MNDDDMERLDKLLAEKRESAERRKREEAEAEERRQERFARNKEIFSEQIVPALEELKAALLDRGFFAEVRRQGTDLTVALVFNPSGKRDPRDVNAHATFNLGDGRLVRVQTSTICGNSGGSSGSSEPVSLEGDVYADVKSRAMAVVLKTV